MGYPAVYCLKCQGYTNTQNRHSIILANNSRALKGLCPQCSKPVSQILPKKNLAAVTEQASSDPSAFLPQKTVVAISRDAFDIKHGELGSKFRLEATCSSCHTLRRGLFSEYTLGPKRKLTLKGHCDSCKSAIRKDFADLDSRTQRNIAESLHGHALRARRIYRTKSAMLYAFAAVIIFLLSKVIYSIYP